MNTCRDKDSTLAFSLRKLAVLVCAILCVEAVYANPTDGVVTSGSATITQTTNTTQINQTSDQAIINWNSFNIGANEATHFQQPSSNSLTLNRINPGQGASQIFGQLTANGRIILVNQAGIYFAPGSFVNVGGIIASTAGITDQNFLAGKLIFDQVSAQHGTVINQGTIIAARNGLVALVGANVSNEGFIQANGGRVILASGNKFTLDLAGDGLINFVIDEESSASGVDQNGNTMRDGVSNSGTIIANGGKILLTAKNAQGVVDNVINMSGVAQARSVSQKNGEIILSGDTQGNVVVSGKIIASGKRHGQTGGTVKVLGANIHLTSQALIDVSGQLGGGKILVGGNFQGKGPEQNALTAVIDAGALLNADALLNGNGGQVVVWSDLYTGFHGSITAQGGALGGNGGEAETSGGYLDISGFHINLLAAAGKTGNLLLDPTNLTISTAGTLNVNSNGPPITLYTGDSASNTSFLNTTALQAALGTASVTVLTTTGGAGTGSGLITVADPITWSGTNTLTINAAGALTINSNGLSNMIAATGGGNLTLISTGVITLNGGISLTGGAVTAGALTINSGGAINVAAPVGGVSVGGAINVQNFVLNTGQWSQTANSLATFNASNHFLVVPGATFTRINNTGGLNGITDVYALQGLATSPTLLSGSYVLSNNIDATNTLTWNNGAGFVRIGAADAAPFIGTLNGQNFVISNLYINSTTANTTGVGLFGIAKGVTIQNLTLLNPTVKSVTANSTQTGTLIGRLLSGSTATTITNVTLINPVVVGGSLLGGAFGQVQFGDGGSNITISKVGVVNPTINAFANYIGGFIGSTDASGFTLLMDQTYVAGGSIVSNGPTNTVGGYGGNIASNVSNSYTTASITVDAGTSNFGGFIGRVAFGSITNSYASGLMTGGNGTNKGGFVGQQDGGNYSGNFWDTASTGVGTNLSNAKGMLTTDFLLLANFNTSTAANGNVNPAWNITATPIASGATSPNNIWFIFSGSTRPMLLAEEFPTTSTNKVIMTPHQLQLIGAAPSESYTLGQNINLVTTNNLAANNAEVWGGATINKGFAPINAFIGTLNGQGNSISNLYILNSNTNVGLISTATGATLSNLGLIAPIVSGAANVGTLVGQMSGGTLTSSYSIGGTVTQTGTSVVGGLVGLLNTSGVVTRSYSSTVVNAGTGSGGGLVGAVNSASITQSFSIGSVSATAGGTGTAIGGLVGTLSTGASITDSYSMSPVAMLSTTSYAGGLVGRNTSGTVAIATSFSTGVVSAATAGYVGAVVGGNSGTINYTTSYWDASTSGLANASGTTLPGTVTGSVTSQTTGQLQFGLPSGFSATNWANITSTNASSTDGSYAYLKNIFTSTPLVISGNSNAGSKILVTLAANGVNVTSSAAKFGTTQTGANGFYYFLQGNNVFASGSTLLAYLPSGASAGSAVTIAPASGGKIVGLTLNTNQINIGDNNANSISHNTLFTAAGSLGVANTLYAVSAASNGNLTVGSATNTSITLSTTANTTFTINGSIGLGVGATANTLNFAGPVIINNAGSNITTTAGQTYGGTVTLNSAASLVGVNISMQAINGGAGGSTTNLTINTTGTSSIAGIFSEVLSSSLTKSGSGTLTLSGNNTYSGLTTVSAGTLSVQNANGLGSTAAGTSVTSGAVLDINGVAVGAEALTLNGTGIGSAGALTGTGTGSFAGAISLATASSIGGAGTLTLSGIISGSNTLTKVGSGTIVLSGNNAYTGLTTISTGTLSAQHANALGTTAAGTSVTAGAVLDINGAAVGAEALTLNGTGIGSAGALTGTGTGSFAGAISLATASSIGGTGTLTLSGIISGSNTLTKVGSGTIALSGNNAYTSLTVVSAGTLSAQHANALGTTAAGTSVTSGATLDINGVAVGAEALTLNGTGVGNVGALTGTGTGSFAGDISLATVSSIGGAGTLTLSGIISGSTTLIKVGASTLVLSGNNAYTGLTTVSAGTLSAQHINALGTTAAGTSVTAGATLDINGVAVGAEALTLNGTGVGNVGALTGTGTGSFAGAISLATASSIGGAGTLTLSGVVSGANILTKVGAGTLILSNTNSYSSTTLNAGTLVALTNTAALGTGAVTLAGGTLSLQADTATTFVNNVVVSGNSSIVSNRVTAGAGVTHTLGTLSIGAQTLTVGAGANVSSGTAGLTLGATTLTGGATLSSGTSTLLTLGSVTGTGQALTVSGVGNTTLSAGLNTSTAGALIMNGTGTLTLAAAGNYTGTTTISNGLVNAQNSSAFGTSAITLNSGAIQINGNGLSFANALTLTGTGIASGGALRNLANNNTWTGAIVLGSGGASIASDLGTLTIATGGIAGAAQPLTIAGVGDVTISAVIGTTTGSVTKNSSGILTLSGANTYSGGTALNTGTLIAQTNAAALGTGTVTLAASTILNLQADTATNFANNIIISGNSNIVSNRVTAGAGVTHTLGTLSIGAQTLTVSAGANVSSGTAGLTLGATTLTGNAVLSSGVNTLLTVGNVTGLGRGLTLTGAGNTTLSAGLNTSTAGTLTMSGTGTVTLAAAGNYTGTTTISFSTVNAQNSSAFGTSAITLNSGAIQINGNGLSFANALTLTGTGIASGGALRNLANNNTWTGAIVLGSGGATIASDLGTLTIATGGITGATQPLTTAGAGNVAISAVIGTTTGSVTKNGVGTLTLSGANTYSGGTTLNTGTLIAQTNAAALGTGAVTLAGLTTLDLQADIATNFGNNIIISGTNSNILSNRVTAGAGVTHTLGTLSIGAQTLLVGAGANVSSGTAGLILGATTLTGNAVLSSGTSTLLTVGNVTGLGRGLTVTGAGNTTLSGGLNTSTAGTLTMNGTGVLTLAAAGNYTGATAISNGVVNAQDNLAFGTSTLTVSSGAVQINGNGLVINNAITLNGTGISGGGALRNLANNNTWSGAITLGSGVRINSDVGTLTIATGGIAGAGQALTIGGVGDTTISAVVGTTTGTLTKDGNGILTLTNGSNSYSGLTTVSAGTLAVTANGALGTTAAGTTVASGATLDLQNVAYSTAEAIALNGGTIATSIGTSSFGGAITLGSAGNIFNVSGGQLTLNGAVSGGFALTKLGSGFLTFAGSNSYTGATNISQGILEVTSANALGNGTNTSGVLVSNGAQLMVNTTLSQAIPVTINGTGVGGNGALNLGNSVQYNGLVTLASDSTIVAKAGSSLATNGINNSGFLTTVNVTGSVFIFSLITGSGGLTINGTNTSALTLTSAINQYTGATIVNGGKLSAAASGSFGNSTNHTSSITIGNGGQLDLLQASYLFSPTLTLSGTGVAGNGALYKGVGSSISYSGAITLAAAATIGNNDSNTFALTGGINNAGFLTTFNTGSGTISQSNVISGAGGVTVVGSGTLLLSGNNSYSGKTTVSSGTLSFNSIANVNGGNSALGAPTTVGNGTIDVSSSGVLLYTGSGHSSDRVINITGSGATIDASGSGALTLSGGITGTDFNLILTGSGSGVQNGVIGTGIGTLTKQSSGTWTLGGANTYSGATIISGGILVANNNSALGTSTVSIGSGSTLQINAGQTIANNLISVNGVGSAGQGAIFGSGNGTSTLSGAVTLAGNSTMGAGASNLLALTGLTLTNAGFTTTFDANTSNLSVSNLISGTGAITKTGSGILTLSNGSNSYSGLTTVSAGTLAITADGALGTTAAGTTVASGATLNLQNVAYAVAEALLLNGGTFATSVGTSSFAGVVTLGAANSIINIGGTQLTINTAITDSSNGFGFTKSGVGRLILGGANTYSGATAISGGILEVNNNAALGSGTASIASGGTLQVNAGQTIANNLTSVNGTGSAGQGAVVGSGSGTSTLSGAIAVPNATIGSEAGNLLALTGSGVLSTSGIITFAANTGNISVSKPITGTGAITKTGSGILTLSNGSNSYSGLTTVSAGTLAITADGALGTTAGGTVVASGATLDLQNVTYGSAEALTLNGGTLASSTGTSSFSGGITLGAANSIINVGGTQLTIGSVIGDGGSGFGFTKSGSGNLILSGNNTYSGSTILNAGTVSVNHNNALGTGSLIFNAGSLAAASNGINLGNNYSISAASAGTISGLFSLALSGTGIFNSGSTLQINNTAATTLGSLAAASAGVGSLVGMSGAGLITFNSSVGSGSNPLSTINIAENINFAGSAVYTSGAQIYSGIVGSIGAAGTAFNSTAGGVISLHNVSNNFTTSNSAPISFSISGGSNSASVSNINSLTFGTSNISNTLFATTLGSGSVISQKSGTIITAAAIALSTNAGDVVLTQNNSINALAAIINNGSTSNLFNFTNIANLAIGTVGSISGITAPGSVMINNNSASITLNNGISANGAGNTIVLAGGVFTNTAGANALNTGSGHFLVWSGNPSNDNRGGIAYNFKQYNASYGVTSVLGTGNGFLYTLAPTITPSLIGTVSKTYDSTTVAAVASNNFSATGAVDGDTVIINPLSGTYASPNVGNNINVSVAGVSIASATNGGATVYGYQLASTSANANVGTITPASLTVSSNSGLSKVYGNNDSGSIATAYGITSGTLFGSDSLTGLMGRLVGETVGSYNFTQNTVNVVDGNSGGNYTITFNGSSNPFQITPRSVTASIADQAKTYGANDPTLAGINVVVGNIVNGNVTDINGNSTAINDTGNVVASLNSLTRVAGETVSGGPYAITGVTFNALSGSAASNYSNAAGFTGSPTLTINKASVTGVITNQTKVYGTNDPSLPILSLSGQVNRTVTNWMSGTTVIDDTSSAALANTLASLTRSVGENVGNYSITGATFNSYTGTSAGNYNVLSSLSGSPILSITKADVTGSIGNQTKVYGANDPTLPNVSLSGQVNTSVTNWMGSSTVINDTTGSQLAVTLASLVRAVGENVGSYNITGSTFNAYSGASAGNYNLINSLTGSPTLSITPATLTASIANQSKVYGANDPSLSGITVNLGGVINNANISTWNGTVGINDTGNVADTLASLTRTSGETVSGGPYAINSATFNGLTGSAASNYNALTGLTAGATLSVTPVSLTASIANQTKVYGANDPSLSGIAVSLSGVINNSNISTWNGTVGINDTGNVTAALASLIRVAGESVSAGPYAITSSTLNISGSAASNYSSVGSISGSPTLSITKADVAGSINNQTKVYGANDPTLPSVSLSGQVNASVTNWMGNTTVINDTTGSQLAITLASLVRAAGENVGSYNITGSTFNAYSGASAGNYNLINSLTGSPTLSITPATLTASIANQSKVYGANDPSLSGITVNLSGVINNANISTWNGTVGINDTGNVADTLASLTRTSGETVSGGPYAINSATFNGLTGSAASNYNALTGLTAGATLSVTPVSLTASIANQTKVYGANDPSLSGIAVSLSGVINNSNISTWNGAVGINDTGNVTAALASLIRVAGESVSSSPYAITSSTLNVSGSAASNYSSIGSLSGSPTLSITKADVTGSINNQTKVYGANDPTLPNVSLSGQVNASVTNWMGSTTVINDTTGSQLAITLASLVRAAGENVGSYNITGSTFNAYSGASAGNYNLINSLTGSPTLSITPATLTASIANQSKVYGANDPSLSDITVNLGGVINNANISTWNGTVGINDTGNVTDTLASLTRTSGETVSGGPYAINSATFNGLTGSAASNYNALTGLTAGATLSVTPVSLTASIANQTKVYGANDPSLSGIAVSLSGVINNSNISTWNGTVGINDTGNVTAALASLIRVAGESVSAGPYAITSSTLNISGSAASNYSSVGSISGSPTLSITKADVTGSISNQTKVYGANDPTLPNVSLSGQVNASVTNWMGSTTVINDTTGSQLAITLASLVRAAGENVGNYNITGSTFNAYNGASAGNYNLINSLTGSPTLSITPATLTASIANQSKTYGVNDPSIAGIAVALNGVVNNSNIQTWNGIVGINDTANVGTTLASLTRTTGEAAGVYSITNATFGAVTGTAASNYGFTNALVGSPNFTINQAGLSSVGIIANNKTYDGNTAATLNTSSATIVSGLVVNPNVIDWMGNSTAINDTVADVMMTGTGAGVFASANVGNNISVTATSVSLSGSAAGNYYVISPAGLSANIIGSNTPAPAPSLNSDVSSLAAVVFPMYYNQVGVENIYTANSTTVTGAANNGQVAATLAVTLPDPTTQFIVQNTQQIVNSNGNSVLPVNLGLCSTGSSDICVK